MDHAKAPAKKLPGMLVGAAVLAVGMLLPWSAPRALEADTGGLFSPTLECESAGAKIDANLLARVRVGASPERRRESAKARTTQDRRGNAQRAGRPSAPRSSRKAPRGAEDPQTAFIRSFYTCNAARSSALTEGTGWRLVGPLRQG